MSEISKFNPDLLMYRIPKEKYNFTPEQIAMIEETADFIFGWLIKRKKMIDNYYDVVIWGFLEGIKKYDPARSNANIYALVSIYMQKSLNEYDLFMNRGSRGLLDRYLSIDKFQESDNDYCYYDADHIVDLQKQVEYRIILNEIFNGDICTNKEKEYCTLLAKGYSVSEISQRLTRPGRTVRRHIKAMRDKLKQKYGTYGELV